MAQRRLSAALPSGLESGEALRQLSSCTLSVVEEAALLGYKARVTDAPSLLNDRLSTPAAC